MHESKCYITILTEYQSDLESERLDWIAEQGCTTFGLKLKNKTWVESIFTPPLKSMGEPGCHLIKSF